VTRLSWPPFLGHEIAHVEKRHGINAVLRQLSLTIAFEMA